MVTPMDWVLGLRSFGTEDALLGQLNRLIRVLRDG